MSGRRVVIAGGGPAGLATAIACRRRGLEVTVVERGRLPLDKACGEGLMPDGLAALKRLGVEPGELGGVSFTGIRYLDGPIVAEADFPGEQGLGVRRPRLQAALAAGAEAAGADLLWETIVEGLSGQGLETGAGLVRGDWIVGADGLHSRIRRWAGFAEPSRARPRFGVRRHYRLAPWSRRVEVHWAAGCEAYVTPVAADEVGVALLWSGGKADFDRLLARFPELEERLRGAEAASRDRGAGPFDQRVREAARGNLALVGDAAGYRDAITGEGLALAFLQAEALGEALARSDLGGYERAFRRLVRVPFLFIRALLLVEARPELRRRLIATLADDPGLFARLLAIHARERPLVSLGLYGALKLLRGLARPA